VVLRPAIGATVSRGGRYATDYYDHSALTAPAPRPSRASWHCRPGKEQSGPW